MTKEAGKARETKATRRRIRASHAWIEEAIATGQRRGLTPTAITHTADGSVTVHFGEDEPPAALPGGKKRKGWDI